jgi:hypothetical protein
MHQAIVMDYIQRRMQELGFGDKYIVRLKHLALEPMDKITIQTASDLYVVIDMPEDLRVESDRGVFDLSDDDISELEYEHSGLITITNQYTFKNHLKMIQAIPN